MKNRITKNDIKYAYKKIFKVPYCSIPELDYFFTPIAYNSGVYGWNYDIYGFGKYAISTGYRPIGEYPGDAFCKAISQIILSHYKDYTENKKEQRECQIECELEIHAFINEYYR